MNSNEIDKVTINGYRDNIEMRFQQKVSKLRRTVMEEEQEGEYDYYDRAGPAEEAKDKEGTNVDTDYTDLPFDRRRIGCTLSYYSTLIDKQSKLRMLADPTSTYVQNGVATINRKIDRKIITAIKANAYAGKNGETTISYSTDQDIAVDYVESGSATNSNLTIPKLRRAGELINDKDQLEDGEKVYILAGVNQKSALLRNEETTSSDYNTVKALVKGEINEFMGFEFIWFGGNPQGYKAFLPKTSNIRDCYYYSESALKLAFQENSMFVDVTRLPTKHYSTQVYVSVDCGATRMWEEKVGTIKCDETK